MFMSKFAICTLCYAAFTVPISANPKTSIDTSPEMLSNGWQKKINLRIVAPPTLFNFLLKDIVLI